MVVISSIVYNFLLRKGMVFMHLYAEWCLECFHPDLTRSVLQKAGDHRPPRLLITAITPVNGSL